MLKKWIVTLILLLVAGTGCNNMAIWGLSTDAADDQVSGRLGIVRNNMEVGVTAKYYEREPLSNDIDAGGAYILFYPDILVDVNDPSPNNIFGDAFGALLAKSYIGAEGIIPLHGEDDHSMEFNWLAGTLISLDPDMKTAMAVQYTTGQAVTGTSDNVVSVGLRAEWLKF